MQRKKISIVVPVYNENYVLGKLFAELDGVMKYANYNFEFIFVNDGSTDESLETLLRLAKSDNRIKVVDLARNFGQQVAVTAGLDYAAGDAIVLMDADLEDRPEDIVKFLEKWEQGYEVIYAVRQRRSVSLLRRICFNIFHRLNKIIYDDFPIDACGIFGLMDRKIVENLNKLRERNRYIPGLRGWVGFKQTGIRLDRGERYDKRSRVRFAKLFALAFNSYFAFSNKPLRIASVLGFLLSFLTFISIIVVIILKLLINFKVSGWASLVAIILFISSVQFMCMGIMGEYIGRIYEETKGRPLYIIKNIYGVND